MKKCGYELMQAEANLWFVAKEDDPKVVAVNNAELKTLMAAEDAAAFARILTALCAKPAPTKHTKG
jgi:hypothetical protein